MKFVDEVEITVISGKGGDGQISFRREKFVPKGGPDGGNGGHGGSVFFKVNPSLNTLVHFRGKKVYRAEDGHAGEGQQRNGRNGEPLELQVPLGTCLINPVTNQCIKEFTLESESFELLRGGRGGLGNVNFKGPVNQTPRYAQPGKEGQELGLKLELKLMADIGIIGLPNAGKSTLISVISNSRPKIADYPFTTLIPNLGVVKRENFSYVISDIPGIIQGAAQGKGLGLRFLKHIDRTKVLLHLVDMTASLDPYDLFENYVSVREEIEQYSKEHETNLNNKKEIVVLTKTDSFDKEHVQSIQDFFEAQLQKKVLGLSAVSGMNMSNLLFILDSVYKEECHSSSGLNTQNFTAFDLLMNTMKEIPTRETA